MIKRILAWIILVGFVLLLLNIAIFKFYWQASLAAYVVIVIFFVLTNGKIIPSQYNGAERSVPEDDVDGQDKNQDKDEDKS